MNKFKKISTQCAVGLIGLCYGQIGFTELVPKFKDYDKLASGQSDGLDIAAGYAQKGMAVLLFIVAMVCIIYGTETIMHGVKEGQKNEASLGALGRYMTLGIIGIGLGLALCFLGWNILTNFSFSSVSIGE